MREQFTGHTAVMARVAGRVVFAKGFVPILKGYIGAFLGDGGYVEQLLTVRDSSQGHMMKNIMGGFQ